MANETNVPGESTFTLGIDLVRWAIEQLVARRIHPFFPAYLTLRKTSAERESLADLHPRWDDLEQFLRVPGGPPKKPNFRPFWHQSSSADQHWLNANLAGSFAPSSIRDLPRRVIEVDDGGGFSLKPKHWELAREHLVFGDQVLVVPLAAFLYRDFGFKADSPSIGPTDLVEVFRRDFGYAAGVDDAEFAHLYSEAVPERDDWFEPFTPDSGEEE